MSEPNELPGAANGGTLNRRRFIATVGAAAAASALFKATPLKADASTQYYYNSFGEVVPVDGPAAALGIPVPPLPPGVYAPTDPQTPDALRNRPSSYFGHERLRPDLTPVGTTPTLGWTPNNMVMIVVDQMRYPVWAPVGSGNNLSAFDALLPNLAKLRNHSIVFTNYCVAATQCTPSRAALLTGLYPQQTCMFQTQGNNAAPSLVPTSNVSGTLNGFPTIGSILTQSFLETSAYWVGKWHLSDFDPESNSLGGNGPIDYGFTQWAKDGPPNLPGSDMEAAPNGLANEGTEGNNPLGGPAPPQTFVGNPNPPVFKPLQFPYGTPVAEYNDAYIADRFVSTFLENVANQNPNSYWFAAVSFVNPHDITFFPYGFNLSGTGNFSFPTRAASLPGYATPLTGGYSNTSASDPWDYYIPALNSSLYTLNPSNWNVYDYPVLGSYDGGAGKPDGQNLYLQYIESSVGSVSGFNLSNATKSDTSGWLTFLNYYFWIQSCVDYQIGRVLGGINLWGFWDNTLILFTADHGEYAGSHWLHGKGSSVYEESMHVPLYISHPVQRGSFTNFNNASTNNSSQVNFVCSSVDILPLLYSYFLGNESWRVNTSDPVNYLSGRESIWDAVFQNEPAQRRTVAINGSNMAYALHTCDDFSPPSNNTYARHVVGMRLVDSSLNVSKFAQYSPWENIPLHNNHPPTSSGNRVVNYTRPFGSNATNSQFELYLPTNRNEIANDYAANPSTGNNYANAMYSVLENELYTVPPTLTSVYNEAFANYWAYQGLNDGESDDNLTMDIGPLL